MDENEIKPTANRPRSFNVSLSADKFAQYHAALVALAVASRCKNPSALISALARSFIKRPRQAAKLLRELIALGGEK